MVNCNIVIIFVLLSLEVIAEPDIVIHDENLPSKFDNFNPITEYMHFENDEVGINYHICPIIQG